MTPRTVLALWADDLDLDLTHSNAAELFDLFKKHGYSIIHDSENHGPTVERAAEVVDALVLLDSPGEYNQGLFDAEDAIRAMEVKT